MIVDTIENLTDANYLTIQLSRVEAATMCVALEGFANMIGMMQEAGRLSGREMTKEDGQVKGHARAAHEMALVIDRYIGRAEAVRAPKDAPRIIIPVGGES